MIESWLQWTCDGCGATNTHHESNVTRAKLRAEMKKDSFQHFAGDLDYCPTCVKNGTAAKRYTGMDA